MKDPPSYKGQGGEEKPNSDTEKGDGLTPGFFGKKSLKGQHELADRQISKYRDRKLETTLIEWTMVDHIKCN